MAERLDIEGGIVRLRPAAAERLPSIDTIIFDIDGVLLDVTRSIRTVNFLVIPVYLRTLPSWAAPDDLITSADIERFKEAGGFNDDWDLSSALVLLFLAKSVRYGSTDAASLHSRSPTVAEFTAAIAAAGGWLAAAEAIVFSALIDVASAYRIRTQYDRSRIVRLFQELWAGDLCPRIYGFEPTHFPGRGWIRLDRPLLDPVLLPPDIRLGCVTGRSRAEAEVALEMVGIADRLSTRGPQTVTKDDGPGKPLPWGMRNLLVRMESRVALYIGDTVDDLRTVLAFRKLPEAASITLLSAQVLTGTTPPELADKLFADTDVLAVDVNAVLGLLAATASNPV